MNQDPGWDKIVDAIDTKFGLTKHGTTKGPLEDRHDLEQTVRFIEFERGGQAFRLERITRPAILDRKSIHGRSANASVHFENVYDPEATTNKTVFYRRDGADWAELDGDSLSAALA